MINISQGTIVGAEALPMEQSGSLAMCRLKSLFYPEQNGQIILVGR